MSAPDHAEAIGEFEIKPGDDPVPGFRCEACGYRGEHSELLGVDPEENTTLWCPVCRSSAWIWE